MKTKILMLVVCILFIASCSTDEQETLSKESTVLNTLLIPSAEYSTKLKSIRASKDYCGEQRFIIYWNRNAQTDFVLREQIRQEFYRYHGLDQILGAFPESIEVDSELWFFFLGEDDYPCHTEGVMAKINHEGNGEVSTDDD